MSTPLMKQYARMKAMYPETILLFRLGDFYETFESDAQVASSVLGITLTKRGNGGASDIPLAGFPHHALGSYMPKLLRAGYRVAVCEQLEDPKFAKGLVKRDVTEVVTPGVAFSESILERKENNYLLAVALPHALAAGQDTIGIAFVDVTTAEFQAGEILLRELPAVAASLSPPEVLVQKRDRDAVAQIIGGGAGRPAPLYSKLDDWIFTFDYGYELLTGQFGTKSLKGFGIDGLRLGVTAAGAAMNYLRETQKAKLLHLKKIAPYDPGEFMFLDDATKRTLELASNAAGGSDGTLFGILDRTRTPMGGRLLRRWITLPLRKLADIRARLDAVGELVRSESLRGEISDVLGRIGDLERLIAKICTGRATPRDAAALPGMLEASSAAARLLAGTQAPALAALSAGIAPFTALASNIRATLGDGPPAAIAEGGAIRSGVSAELDELRGIASGGKAWIAALQIREREATGIPSLKVGYNNVFGYYIEITNAHSAKVPDRYIRRQTMTNAERFVTPELKEYEEKILHAEEKILALETRLFNELLGAIAHEAAGLQENARLIAAADAFLSLADSAAAHRYAAPEVNDGPVIDIAGGRHPVIERLLPPGESYTPNDILLDNRTRQVMIITGPNMSGKSSFLRQTGLIVLMAQAGSFVPAARASIGIVDRISTRVGASDNIASGESTFLVEMHEAANIVNTATPKSLILLDEVGRGTSTFDGISIAWALTEYLHDRVGAKTLFATHYHELNELADHFARIVNLKVDVREIGDRVVFLHTVTPGFADHSYGIHVARMAGLPEEVTSRAAAILKNLEGSELTLHAPAEGATGPSRGARGARTPRGEMQMTLFEPQNERLREALRSLDPERMTPIDALQALIRMKKECS